MATLRARQRFRTIRELAGKGILQCEKGLLDATIVGDEVFETILYAFLCTRLTPNGSDTLLSSISANMSA